MTTADDRPYDQETVHEEPAAGRAGGRDTDDTGVERHAPNSSSELWDHNAYGREDGNIGGSATSGATDTRDPRGGAPAYNIDAGDDDAVRHGDDSGRDDGTNVRETGESLTGADATAGSGRESVGDGSRGEPSAAGRTSGRARTARGGDRGDTADPDTADPDTAELDTAGPGTRGPGATERGGRPDEDAAVVRHEERLRVATERVESGRTRLRKYVVEEPVRAEQTLVSEDVEEVRTAITEEEREAFLAGTELPLGDDEVILYREVPVVQTVRVPYERVRLVVRRAERTEVIEDTVRKERVEVEED